MYKYHASNSDIAVEDDIDIFQESIKEYFDYAEDALYEDEPLVIILKNEECDFFKFFFEEIQEITHTPASESIIDECAACLESFSQTEEYISMSCCGMVVHQQCIAKIIGYRCCAKVCPHCFREFSAQWMGEFVRKLEQSGKFSDKKGNEQKPIVDI